MTRKPSKAQIAVLKVFAECDNGDAAAESWMQRSSRTNNRLDFYAHERTLASCYRHGWINDLNLLTDLGRKVLL